MASAPNGYPFGKCGVDDWEIEHINHFAEQKSGVPAASGKEFCHLSECTFAEYHTVKERIDDIAEGAAEDGGEAQKDTCRGIFALEEFPDVYNDGYDKHHSEDREDKFANVASKLHSEGHAVIFNE